MQIQKVTPNLMVQDMNASLEFYQQLLGMERTITVPDQAPFVFAAVSAGSAEIFLNKNDAGTPPKAGGISMYVEVEGLDQLLARVQQRGWKIAIELNETFYGMREFAVNDPDGYMVIFAERKK